MVEENAKGPLCFKLGKSLGSVRYQYERGRDEAHKLADKPQLERFLRHVYCRPLAFPDGEAN